MMLKRYGKISVSRIFDMLLIIVINNENCGSNIVIMIVKIMNIVCSE